MNPDQTPTPETDAAIRHEGGQRYIDRDNLVLEPVWDYVEPDFARTLEHQRDTARAEVKEAKEVVASLLQNSDSLRAEVARLTKERDEFQAELQKVCDHDWQHIDDSFDHEFGTEQVHSCLCEKCGATKPYEPETFGDEAI